MNTLQAKKTVGQLYTEDAEALAMGWTNFHSRLWLQKFLPTCWQGFLPTCGQEIRTLEKYIYHSPLSEKAKATLQRKSDNLTVHLLQRVVPHLLSCCKSGNKFDKTINPTKIRNIMCEANTRKKLPIKNIQQGIELEETIKSLCCIRRGWTD
ncbi:hypothetical protein Fot_12874 [Forsythia ovata]|uniref:Uncharacterized protein n=1 Tax=Forsythia ovata TaxID=205694 RepID=A0ABD1W1Z4_9LAMI